MTCMEGFDVGWYRNRKCCISRYRLGWLRLGVEPHPNAIKEQRGGEQTVSRACIMPLSYGWPELADSVEIDLTLA